MFKNIKLALQKSRKRFHSLLNIFEKNNISESDILLIEEMLVESDIGYDLTQEILKLIRKNKGYELKSLLKNILLNYLPKGIKDVENNESTIFLVVGVNGTGKTTSAAKLTKHLINKGCKVSLIAGDTYRAAAIEQLKIWAEKIGCHFVYNQKTSDPSSIIFDGMVSAMSKNSDKIVIDTAGRLHNNENLMFELKKIYDLVGKRFGNFKLQTLITIDANLGQNSIYQAEGFKKYIKLQGVILTKLDGSAKGGVVFQLYQKLGLNIQYIGYGEGLNDLDAFDRDKYVNGLIGM